jgi:hypothetical protein
LRRDVSKDDMLSLDDVEEPPRDRLVESLWQEQRARWPLVTRGPQARSMPEAPVEVIG